MTRISAMRRSFPTAVSLLAPIIWISGSWRRIGAAAAAVLAIVAALPVWWALQLVGLPDIGDPFDVQAFRAVTIPDDRNAFVLYRQAAALLKPRSTYLAQVDGKVDPLAPWPTAVPELHRWVDDNRQALAVFRRGTERPDALDPSDRFRFDRDRHQTFANLDSFRPLVLLEASRLEEQGDMAGAWGWYRALLRFNHHMGMDGSFLRRYTINRYQKHLVERLSTWATHPKTSPSLLRQALDDVIACEAMAPSELDALKSGYLEATSLLDSPGNPGHRVPLMRFRRFWHPEYQLNPEHIQALWDSWRFWRGEPERSRRVIRLITANWLAYHTLPAGKRPNPDPRVASLDFYRLGPESPANASIVAPEAFDRWFDSA